MKVRCIDGSWSSNELTTGKEYEVLSEVGCYYQLKINDKGIRYHCYVKSRFEVIKEHKDMKFKIGDKVRVREDLVIGNCYGKERFVDGMKEYKGQIFTIKEIYRGVYIFEKNLFNWTDEMLEKVKKEKETQEKTFREVITDIKEGEVWESKTGKKVHLKRDKLFIDFNHEVTISGTVLPLNEVLTLQKKQYTFDEAFKAYEEGKEIESCYSQYKYKKEGGLDLYSKTENEWYGEDSFEIDEIRGKWYINN